MREGVAGVMNASHGSANRRRLRSRAPAAVSVALALACAVSEPPSGGPEDKTPPGVTSTIPRADSAGVEVNSRIRIAFSEPMTRARIERLFESYPPIRIGWAGWEGGMLTIQPEGGLARDTTYVVRLKAGFRDAHGVEATAAHEFAFATGAALDSARIEGTVRFRREPSAKAIVRAFRVTEGDTIAPEVTRPHRETATGRDGRYALRYLPSGGGRFVVMGFVDQNGNGRFDRDGDPVAIVADTVTLTAALPIASDVDIAVIDPREPGGVKGVVINESGIDSARVLVGLYAAGDSVRAAYLAACDSTGAYELRTVKPGEYTLLGFVDARADSAAGTWPCPGSGATGCPEPRARLAAAVVVKPAATVEAPALYIRRPEDP